MTKYAPSERFGDFAPTRAKPTEMQRPEKRESAMADLFDSNEYVDPATGKPTEVTFERSERDD
jgi:hypothetical protein